jgi:hypothetical protein
MHLGTPSQYMTHEDVGSHGVDGTLQGQRHLRGHGPHQADEFPRDGPSDDVGVLALRHQALGALAQPDWGLPPAVLHAFGLVCEASWQRATNRRGRAVRPSAFDQPAAGMGLTGLRHPSLVAPLARGRCCWDSPQALPQCAGRREAGHVPHCCHHGDGHRARHATEGLEGVHHGRQAPRRDLRAACVCQPPEALWGFRDGPALFVQDDRLRRGGTDDFRPPPQVSRAPIGPARRADILAEHEGLETQLGVFASAEPLFARPRAIPERFIVHCGDRHRRAIPGAGSTGQLDRITAVRCAPLPRLLGHQGRSHDPAVVAFLLERPRAPRATRPRFGDAHEVVGFRLPRAEQGVASTLACADRPKGGNRSARLVCHVRDRKRLFVDIHADEAGARLGHG